MSSRRVPLCAELPAGVIGTGWTVKISNMTLTARADRLTLPGLRQPCAIPAIGLTPGRSFATGKDRPVRLQALAAKSRGNEQESGRR
jgi:hypothetical protein